MKKIRGFTLLEMTAVVAIIAVLAALALPSYLFKITREQIEAAIVLADLAKKPVAATWLATQSFPANNDAAGLPAAEKIVNNYVSAITIDNGAINILFGNRATSALKVQDIDTTPGYRRGCARGTGDLGLRRRTGTGEDDSQRNRQHLRCGGTSAAIMPRQEQIISLALKLVFQHCPYCYRGRSG